MLHFNGENIHLETDISLPSDDSILLADFQAEDIEEEMCWGLQTKKQKNAKPIPQIKLSKEDLAKFNKVIGKMEELFAYDISDLKTCNVGKHVIRTIDCPPVFTPP